jgi:hypothetical protein
VAVWQWIVLAFFVLLPFALLADLHPDRERLTARGVPLARTWTPQVSHPDPHDDHH